MKVISLTLNLLGRLLMDACIALVLLVLLLAVYVEADAYKMVEAASSAEYQAYKPVEDDTASFDELAAENPDVIGWLTLQDTGVDYPVVQGRTNDDYINTSVLGEFSLTGSIFLDSRNARDFSDTLNIVYGHNMTGGVMFGGLDRYTEAAYFQSHSEGTLYCGGEYYRLRIFLCFSANGYDAAAYRPGLREEDFMEWLDYVTQFSYQQAEPLPTAGRILLMSTCTAGATDGRTLVAAEILPGGTAPKAEPRRENGRSALAPLTEIVKGGISWPWLLLAAVLLAALTGLYLRCRRKEARNGRR